MRLANRNKNFALGLLAYSAILSLTAIYYYKKLRKTQKGLYDQITKNESLSQENKKYKEESLTVNDVEIKKTDKVELDS